MVFLFLVFFAARLLQLHHTQTSNIQHQTSNKNKNTHIMAGCAMRRTVLLVCDSVKTIRAKRRKKTGPTCRINDSCKPLPRVGHSGTTGARGARGARGERTPVGGQKTKAAARKVGIPEGKRHFCRNPSRPLAPPRAPSRSLGRNRRQAVISRRLRRFLRLSSFSNFSACLFWKYVTCLVWMRHHQCVAHAQT